MTHAGAVTVTRIVALELVRLRPSLAGRDSDGTVPVLVRVSDGRVNGWGEAPRVTPKQWDALARSFAPALLHHPWRRPTEVAEAFADLPWDPVLVGALDTACWDLWSRQRSTPLAHALGGSRTALTAGSTLPRQVSLESVITQVNQQVGAGYRRVKLEVGPGRDIDVVRAVQTSFPFLVLQVDGGGRYTESESDLDALRSLDTLGLVAIEDPFGPEDMDAYARLTAELRTPVALHRSLTSLEDLSVAIRAEAGRAANIDPAWLGGLTAARRAVDMAVDAGWRVWCGSSARTGVGRAATVALASLEGASLPVEMPRAGARGRDLMIPPVRAHDGVVPVPLTGSGLGHELDSAALPGVTARTLLLGSPQVADPSASTG